MMRRPLALLALGSLLLAGGCAKKVEAPAETQALSAPAAPARSAGEQDAGAVKIERQGPAPVRIPDAGRKLVKTVDLEMRVADTTGTAEKLRALADSMGGYVSAMSADRRNDLLYYSLTLRVPVDRLEEALQKVKALGERIESESIKTEDVTARWVDLDAQLTTLRATETELRQLLSEARQRQQKVEDIMAVYKQLVEIRTSIEQLQGEQQALARLTSLSTINVALVPTEAARPIVVEGWNPGGTLRNSFRNLVGALQWLVDVAIVLLIVVLPIGLAILLPVWLLVRLWGRLRQQRAAGTSE